MGYDAFISYSHAADGRLAPAVQSGLQRLARPWYRTRALRVFRDETGLAVNPHLWTSIRTALDGSEFFVLLASPAAAASPWVNRELDHWLASKPPERVLTVLTEGELAWDAVRRDYDLERSTALPPALAGQFVEEPKHLDLRWARDETELDLRHVGFRAAIAGIAAPVHGVSRDELESEDVRQYRRRLRLAWASGLALVFLTLAAFLSAGLAVSYAATARSNEQRARTERARATRNARDASSQRTLALENARQAKDQKASAESNATAAGKNAAEADSQRNLAEQNAAQATKSAGEAAANGAQAQQKAAEAAANADEAQRNAAAAQQSADEASTNADEAQRNAATAQRNEAEAQANAKRAAQQQQDAEHNARVALSRQLASQALQQADGHLDRALLLAVQAWKTEPTTAARNSLFTTTEEAGRGLLGFLHLPGDAPAATSGGGAPTALSSDGRYFAEALDRVYVWDRSTYPAQVRSYDPGGLSVTNLSFTPDAVIASAVDVDTLETHVLRWDLADGSMTSRGLGCICGTQAFGRFLEFEWAPATLEFLDTRTLDVVDRPGYLGSRFDPASPGGCETRCTGGGGRFLIGYSLDASDKPQAVEWDLDHDLTPIPLTTAGGPARRAEFDPTGSRIVGSLDDGTIVLFDPETGAARPGPPLRAPSPVLGIAASPDQTRVGALSSGVLTILDVASGESRATPVPAEFGGSVSFSPSGKIAVVQAERLTFVDAETGTKLAELDAENPVFSSDEHAVFVDKFRPQDTFHTTDVHIVWDLIQNAPIRADTQSSSERDASGGVWLPNLDDPAAEPVRLPGSGSVTATYTTPDGAQLIGVTTDGTPIVWSTKLHGLGSVVAQVPADAYLHGGYAGPASAVSPDGRTLAQVEQTFVPPPGGTVVVKLTDLATGAVTDGPAIVPPSDRRFGYSPDGRSFVINETVLADVISGAARTAPDPIVAFSGDGARLVTEPSGSTDLTIRKTSDFSAIRTISTAPLADVAQVALDADGARLAAVDDAGTAITWDVARGSASAPLRVTGGDKVSGVPGLTLSPDGTHLAVHGADHAVRIWDTRTGTVSATLSDITGPHLAFNRDGSLLATEQPTQLWNADTLEPVGQALANPVRDFVFTTDGAAFLVVGEHAIDPGEVRRFDIDPASLVAQACSSAGRDLTAEEARQFLGAATAPVCSATG